MRSRLLPTSDARGLVLSLLLRLKLLRLARQRFVGHRLERAAPVERSGVHLQFRSDERFGLRLETIPAPGWVLPYTDAPPRLKGGRGAWPDLVAALDVELKGEPLSQIRISRLDGAVELAFESGRLLLLQAARNSTALYYESVRSAARTLGAAVGPLLPGDDAWIDDPVALERRAGEWISVQSDPSSDSAALDLERRFSDLGSRLRRALLIDLQEAARGAQPEREQELLDYAAEAYRRSRAEAALFAGRDRLLGFVRNERKRIKRALNAITREEQSAPDPDRMRRIGDALLATGLKERIKTPTLELLDPYSGEPLSVEVQPPGSSAVQLAEAAYSRARKIERGRGIRHQRRAELELREGRLASVEERGAELTDTPQLDLLEGELRSLGMAVGVASSATLRSGSARSGGGKGSRPARLFSSPSGFEVLVGRSAKQNDQITFKIATPADYWFHIKQFPGAHVLLRLGGKREPSELDLRFAARLAASFSQAPKGESVEVHVLRRRDLARPSGGRPGQVLVRRPGKVIVAVAEAIAD